MPGIGGSIVGVNIHGREFSVTADSDSGRKLGGAMNEVQPNGDGTTRIVSIREAWSSGELTLSIDNDRADQEYLQDIADRRAYGDCTVSYADGSIYQGSGTVTGELVYSSAAATMPVTIMGQGKMTKQ